MGGVLTNRAGTVSADEAYRYCERLARSHYENFTVGSLLIPKAHRKHLYAIYAYCRWVDDLGDEPMPVLSESLAQAGWPLVMDALEQPSTDVPEHARRIELLDRWAQDLEACYTGAPTHPAMIALQHTISVLKIPREPFLKLLEANRMEQRSSRYPTYQDLLFYCDHSANPVGHLFLYLFGYSDPERHRLSDYTCTALQLANFWQDVARDYKIGRIYLPLEDMTRFGYAEEDLSGNVVNENFRSLMAFQVQRAKEFFELGLPLVNTLKGVAKVDVALFTMGGTAVLKAIKKQNYDVLSRRPTLSRTKKSSLFLSTWAKMRLGRGISIG